MIEPERPIAVIGADQRGFELMTKFVKAWIIPGEVEKISVAYQMENGGTGMRTFFENDPDAEAIKAAMAPEERKKLEDQLKKVLQFPKR